MTQRTAPQTATPTTVGMPALRLTQNEWLFDVRPGVPANVALGQAASFLHVVEELLRQAVDQTSPDKDSLWACIWLAGLTQGVLDSLAEARGK